MGIEIIAAAAIVSAGVSVYSAMSQPDAPSIPPPPPPSGAQTTDEEGIVTSKQVFNSATNMWESQYSAYGFEPSDKASPEYQKWTARKSTWEGEKRQQTIGIAKTNAALNQQNIFTTTDPFTGEVITGSTGLDESKATSAKVAEAYKGLKSDYAVDEYGNVTKNQKESTEARGLTGSKYDVDITGQRENDYQKLLANIGKEGVMLESDLNQKAFENTMNLGERWKAGEKSDKLLALEAQSKTAQQAQAGNADLLARYSIGNDNILNKWKIESDQNANRTRFLGETSGALAMAYGYGSNPYSTKSPIMPKTLDTSDRYVGNYSGKYL